MTEKIIREFILDKEKFMNYAKESIAKEDVDIICCNEIKRVIGRDKLGREVFWELDDNFETRQYFIYPFEDNICCVAYLSKNGEIFFLDENDEDCSEEAFFDLVNKILEKKNDTKSIQMQNSSIDLNYYNKPVN